MAGLLPGVPVVDGFGQVQAVVRMAGLLPGVPVVDGFGQVQAVVRMAGLPPVVFSGSSGLRVGFVCDNDQAAIQAHTGCLKCRIRQVWW
jgi:hypothetical protein